MPGYPERFFIKSTFSNKNLKTYPLFTEVFQQVPLGIAHHGKTENKTGLLGVWGWWGEAKSWREKWKAGGKTLGVPQRSAFGWISFNGSLINLAQKVRVFKWNLQIVQSWEAPSTQTKIAISHKKNWMTLRTEVIETGWNWTVQNARSCTKELIMRISARSCWERQRRRKTWVC